MVFVVSTAYFRKYSISSPVVEATYVPAIHVFCVRRIKMRRKTQSWPQMSKRIDKSWLVLTSIENFEHDRCVDLFSRTDGSYGFEEFRRDAEDRGEWTPVSYYSRSTYASQDEALAAAMQTVTWLDEAIKNSPCAQKLLSRHTN